MRSKTSYDLIFKCYPATLSYLFFIVLLNTLFTYVPDIDFAGQPVSIADFVVGLIYVFRDFAQRESRHWVIPAMLLGCLISWFFAEEQAALASVAAFAVGEILDWGIYTFTRKPLSRRILWSSLISSPIDSAVLLYFLERLQWTNFAVMTLTKFAGVILLWLYWRYKAYQPR